MSSHVYAIIVDGVVDNIIVATPAFISDLGLDGTGRAVRIDNLSPTPGVGWTYRRRRFAPPTPRVDPFAGLFPAEHPPVFAHLPFPAHQMPPAAS